MLRHLVIVLALTSVLASTALAHRGSGHVDPTNPQGQTFDPEPNDPPSAPEGTGTR